MLLPKCVRQFFSKTGCASIVGLLSLSVVHSVMSAAPAQTPLFVTLPVKPVMMLNMSNDHQLFFKAYDDYSDITGDGNVDTSYVHSYPYYGYFDSSKCYVYSGGRFAPQPDTTGGRYCSDKWSGNFLNWATMTRMDAVRKILYGGYRHVDTATETVLERALLPNDAHSFTKYYNGPDLAKLTPSAVSSGVPMEKPDTEATGITICNTTNPANRSQFSQNVTDAPQMMVAEGNYSLWASNERWQCRWGQGSNGNDSEETDIYAYGASPTTNARLGDFNVRVKVCVSQELVGEEKCQAYGSRLKPTGLLQKFGANGGILFGLITGSYGKNKSGGVLRKNIGLISDEIKEDGTFKVPASGNSIIKTLDLLKIYGYDYNEGVYNSGDNCAWALTSFTNGNCSNWGNPQAEIYLESLRYLAGRSQKFAVDDSSRIAGLKTAAWVKPITNDNYCAPLNVLQFNASTTSYDGDVAELANNTSDIGLASVSSATNIVGANEGIHGGTFLVGETSSNKDKLCTPKTVGSLSDVKGTCPDAPRLEGTYQIAGIAHHARSEGITIQGISEANKKQVVRTFGVALAPAVPKIEIPVPGKDGQKITILPACRNHLNLNQSTNVGTSTNCAIVDFKVFNSEVTEINGSTVNRGKLYVNWEDSEQGGDYDQDMWGIIDYAVSSTTAEITSQVIAQSTGDPMGFGYIITGTENDDGFQVHSGVNGFRYGTSCTTAASCTCANGTGSTPRVCTLSDEATKTYTVGTSSASTLQQPLYYAAKWGGYSEALQKEAEKEGATQSLKEMIKTNDASDSYFFATNPRDLETALEKAFQQILEQAGTASSVATNSTRLVEGANFYQALFDAKDWSGVLQSMVRSGGEWITGKTTANNLGGSRKILTANEARTELVAFEWDNLGDWREKQLLDEEIEGDDAYNAAADDRAKARIEWIKGTTIAGDGVITRATRTKLLGDIVNSSPVFSGNKSPRYSQLPGTAGSSYADYDKKNSKAIFVGANDGMLHAFDADTLSEIFAYIPTAVYPKLAQITRPDYGTAANQHQFLVDGSLYVGDAYLNGGWKTILFGSLGAGGRSVFALDVTNPSSPKLLFELDQSNYPQLGYVLGQPAIVPLANGSWAAVFGNGYDASTSHLFVIDLENPLSPTHSRVIDTGAGTGLSTPALLPNRYGQIEYAYAGDLKGNLWKFDLSSKTPSEWEVSNSGKPLFEAKDKNGRAQPITGGITLGVNDLRDSALMVYFGTGKYFEPGDNAVYNAAVDPQHSFYALVDIAGGIANRSELHKKTISGLGTTRTVTGEVNKITTGDVVTFENAVDWLDVDGWYMDFPIGGERVITKPVLLMDRLIFNTIIPSQSACDYGGSSWALELIAIGDKQLGHSVMGDSATALDELVVGESGIMTGKGGEDDGDKGIKLDCNVLGDCESHEMVFWDGWRGRMNWREIR